MKKQFILLLSIILLSLSCSKKDNEGLAEGRVIEHAMGTTIAPKNPKRIVVLTNEGIEALISLGVKPVGAAKARSAGDKWYPHLEKHLEGVVNLGDERAVNFENIVALSPDLILGNMFRQEKIYEALSKIAPTVFSKTIRGDWQKNLLLYAEAIGLKESGEKVISDYKAKVKSLSLKLGEKKNREVSLVRFFKSMVRLYQKNTFAGTILNDIGFKRVKNQDVDGFVELITRERIKDIDGDIIFHFTYDSGDGVAEKNRDEWLSSEAFLNFKAVKNNKVFEVDDVIWNTSGGVIAANMVLDEIELLIPKL